MSLYQEEFDIENSESFLEGNENHETEFFQEKDEYEEIDNIIQINYEIQKYIKTFSLPLCEYLNNKDIVNILY